MNQLIKKDHSRWFSLCFLPCYLHNSRYRQDVWPVENLLQLFPQLSLGLGPVRSTTAQWVCQLNNISNWCGVVPDVLWWLLICRVFRLEQSTLCMNWSKEHFLGMHDDELSPCSVFVFLVMASPLLSNRHHPSSDDCLEGKGENYQVCSVQYCVQQLCTVRCTYIWTD